VSLVCVVLELAMAIVVMTALGRWFRLSPKLTSLLAIGASVCGVSAIIAAKGAIEADDEDVSYAIAAILALGAVSLVGRPLAVGVIGEFAIAALTLAMVVAAARRFVFLKGEAISGLEPASQRPFTSRTFGRFAVCGSAAR